MKKYIVILSCFLLVLACNEDFLEQQNPNTLTPDNFWQTESDAQKAIIGAYSPMSTIFYHGRLFPSYALGLSDEVKFNAGLGRPTSLYNMNPGDGNFTLSWGEFWKVIFRANQVLVNVPDIDMDTDLKNNILGEAYFLRAYNYFMLVNYWRNVPLVTTPATLLSETQQPQAKPEAVWDQIESDLTAAVANLPNSWDDSNKGRVTAGAAAALLGKAHLYQEEWSNAATALKRVIDGEFGEFGLAPTFAENFTESGENNIESLFEIQYDMTGAWTAGWGSDVPSTARYNSFGSDLANPNLIRINQWVLDLFLSEQTIDGEIDPRAFGTLVWDYPEAEFFGRAFTAQFANDLAAIRTAKYVDPNGGGVRPAFNTFAVNKKIIRYADVLLMYAEAENEVNGPTADAYEAIKQVRDRANMPELSAGLSKEDFRQGVRDERVLELTLEGHRQLDILRWGMLPDRILDNPDFRNGNPSYVPGREYFPIPALELGTNPQMVQNPGYE